MTGMIKASWMPVDIACFPKRTMWCLLGATWSSPHFFCLLLNTCVFKLEKHLGEEGKGIPFYSFLFDAF